MNSSSELCNISDWLRLEAAVKASVYVVAFSIATSVTIVIIAIVSQSLQLRKEVRLVLLCHHLLCVSSYCGLGVVFQGIGALLANSPLLLCWLVFGAQLSVGEGILLTLTLRALHTYLAIGYPLSSPYFADSAKLGLGPLLYSRMLAYSSERVLTLRRPLFSSLPRSVL